MTTGKIGVLLQSLTVLVWGFSASNYTQLVLRDFSLPKIRNCSRFSGDKGSPHNLVADIPVQICMGDMVGEPVYRTTRTLSHHHLELELDELQITYPHKHKGITFALRKYPR